MLFGDRRVESRVVSTAPGVAEAFPFKSTARGTAMSLGVYVDTHNRAETITVGLYSGRNGQPASRLAQKSLSHPRPGRWNTLHIRATTIASRTTYWLVVLGTHGRLYFRARAHGSCHDQTSHQTNLKSLESSWRRGARRNHCPLSAYVAGKRAQSPTGTTLGVNNPTGPTPTAAPGAGPSIAWNVSDTSGDVHEGETVNVNDSDIGTWSVGSASWSVRRLRINGWGLQRVDADRG